MAKGKYAVAISDRSGFKFPWREMVREPGTGYIVHRSESDGKYNLVDHPQNHVGTVRTENIALSWSRPEQPLGLPTVTFTINGQTVSGTGELNAVVELEVLF
jgi:hypothetical protein